MTDQYYERQARKSILKGAEKVYRAVVTTAGPRGRNVAIELEDGTVTVTHDGVTVAKNIHLTDKFEQMGAKLMIDAALKLEKLGDGTTSAVNLSYHILKEANKKVDGTIFHQLLGVYGVNPMILSREIEAAADEVLEYLEAKKLPADSLQTLEDIATISAADKEIGEVVSSVVHKVGASGIVTVEPASKPDTTSQLVTGVVVERGYTTPHMVTDEKKGEAVYEDAAIILIDHEVRSFLEILPILEKVSAEHKQIVIIADDFEGDTLPTLVLNNRSGVIKTLAINAPAFNDFKRQILEDLAAATGATVISQDTVTIKDAPIGVVGFASKVVATEERTVFIGCAGDASKRLELIARQLKKTSDDYEKEKLEKRQALLTGKVAVIRVGGHIDTKIDEKMYRVDDAVAAAKAAKSEGILPGGGTTLYSTPVYSHTRGAKVLSHALRQPMRRLVANSGLSFRTAKKAVKQGKGLNVMTGEVVDLIEAGIIDPYSVTKEVVKTAVSLGSIGITMGALIVQKGE